ncbi:MAG: M43 family zinc metalloprotease [Chitinophagales bacterium]
MKNIVAAMLLMNVVLSSHGQGWCGMNSMLDKYRANDPALEAAYQNRLQEIRQMQQNEAATGDRALSDNIYIPVVFHVIHNGDAVGTGENISDAQIISQIDAMNLHFSLKSPDTVLIPSAFRSLAADTKIQFCLAGYDPSGQPTTGINRYNLNKPDWDENMLESIVKPATRWDYKSYLNIWVIRPGDTMTNEGVLAYTTPSFWGWGNLDGIVTRYNCVGTTGALQSGYLQGKTLTHEVGHWLGLNHTWGPNNGGSASCNDGDNVNDTPNQYDLTPSCATFPLTDQCTTTAPGIMFMNYMDYPPDACRTMYTLGQSTRMHSTIDQNRAQIKNSIGKCFASRDAAMIDIQHPTDSICSLEFNPLISFKNNGQTNISSVTFSITVDGNTQTTVWTGLLEPLSKVTLTLNHFTVSAGTHSISVSITDVNGSGSDNRGDNDGITKSFKAYDGGTAYTVPFREDFESGIFPPSDFEIVNPSNDFTWSYYEFAGGFGTSYNSIAIDNSSSSTNSKGRRDDFLTGNFDFTNKSYANLAFDLAYSKRGNLTDTLSVWYSTDCGAHWNLIWKDGGVHLATSTKGDTMKPFVPEAEDWVRKSFDLSMLNGQSRVRFMFRNLSGWGNAVYVDNINVDGSFTAVEDVKPVIEIKVQPNPANRFVSVKLPANYPYQTIDVIDLTGRIVATQQIVDALTIISTSELEDGVYTLSLHGKGEKQAVKIVVAK